MGYPVGPALVVFHSARLDPRHHSRSACSLLDLASGPATVLRTLRARLSSRLDVCGSVLWPRGPPHLARLRVHYSGPPSHWKVTFIIPNEYPSGRHWKLEGLPK